MNQEFLDKIEKYSPKFDYPLAEYTTYKIGGPAEILVVIKNSKDLEQLICLAVDYNVPYRIIGWGANILVADRGLKGLVIINRSRNIQIQDTDFENIEMEEKEGDFFNPFIKPRHTTADEDFYSFEDLDYKEGGERVKVTFDSGVDLPFAIAYTLKNGLTGLQWFAGIPSTLGGALYNNIHGGTRHFSDYFVSAEVLDPQNGVEIYDYEKFQFGYDQSVLRKNSELVVLTITLNLFKGDKDKAQYVAREWSKRKRRQAKNSCGCVFKNIVPEKQEELNLPTPSVGYIVDKKLQWSGKSLGGAQISTEHANFILNQGGAKAADVLQLIKEISLTTKEQFDLTLEPEINLLGFTQEELSFLNQIK
jgi:UDP-N-acetylmuramate dehydrogenase